jgi:hypothetical protein
MARAPVSRAIRTWREASSSQTSSSHGADAIRHASHSQRCWSAAVPPALARPRGRAGRDRPRGRSRRQAARHAVEETVDRPRRMRARGHSARRVGSSSPARRRAGRRTRPPRAREVRLARQVGVDGPGRRRRLDCGRVIVGSAPRPCRPTYRCCRGPSQIVRRRPSASQRWPARRVMDHWYVAAAVRGPSPGVGGQGSSSEPARSVQRMEWSRV